MEQILQSIQNTNYSMNFTSGGLGLLVYILQAWALYTIAERRGIKKPWLAWIPVVNVWILGSISDQYQYVVKKQVKNKRKVLLGINIAIAVLVVIFVVALLCFFVSLAMMGISMELFSSGNMPNSYIEPSTLNAFSDEIGVLLLICLTAFPMLVLAIVQAVFTYMALYDVYRSCDPKNSTVYTVLSIVGNFVIDGVCCIFLMLCKEKDLGMPPKKEEVVEIPAETLEE